MSIDEVHAELEGEDEPTQLTRSGLVRGGIAAAGLTMLGAPATAFGAGEAAATTRIAIVTHGDTGAFWSVFKRGVDQAARDLRSRGVTVTQVYANNNVARQVSGINAAIASRAKVIATSVPDASALKDALTRASRRGIHVITVNSGLGAFDSLPTYGVHVGQTEDLAGQGAGKQFKAAGVRKVLIVIHEAANVGLQQRATGVRKIMGGSGVKVLTIPNAKSDIPGTRTKVQAAFRADRSLDGFLGLDPDVTIPVTDVLQSRVKVGTFDVGGAIRLIRAGRMLFAIDQQQYLQGYLPVVFGMLYVSNLNTVGNGQPVLTGPGIINRANAARVAALAAKGTR
jgi:simple sugar transport system substrate-binding protein